MSDRNGASRQKTATEDSLRLLIDTTPAFIHTALPDGALDFLNQGWLEFIGVPLTDLLGWRWTSAIILKTIEDRKWAEEELRRSEAYLSEAQRFTKSRRRSTTC
jgi:PAS domain-containing protein